MSATSCTAEVAERVKLQKHICSSSADEVNEIKARLHLVFSSEMHPNTGQGDYSPTSVHRHTGISIKITQISLCSDYHQDSYFSPPSSINPHVSKPKSMFNFGVIFLIHMFIFKFFSPLLPPSLLTQKGFSCSADSGAYLLTQQPKIRSHSSQVCEEQLSHHLLLSLPGKSKKRPNKAVCSQLCYQGTWHYQLILDYYSSPRKIKHPFVVKCNWLL